MSKNYTDSQELNQIKLNKIKKGYQMFKSDSLNFSKLKLKGTHYGI